MKEGEIGVEKFFSRTNPMFKEVLKGKVSGKIFSIFSGLIILLISQILLIPIVFALSFLISSGIDGKSPILQPITLIISTGVSIFAVYLIVRFKEKREFKTIGLNFKKGFLKEYFIGFILGIGMIALIALFIVFIGGGKFSINLNLSSTFIITFLFMIVGWVVQGASEEIMIRGYIMPVVGVSFNPYIGVIFSSVIFSAFHLGNPGISFLSLINLALFGFFAAFYSLYRGNIIGICALHSAWNFAQGNIFGFLVSGTEHGGVTLVNTVVESGNIINGGAFGPEGGILTTITLIAGIIIIWFLNKK